MSFKKTLYSTIIAFLLFFYSGGITSAQEKLQVMATFYPVYFLVDQIGGDLVETEMLLGASQDPHNYEVSVQDATRVQGTDLFIYQDDEMEFFVSDLLNLIDTEQTQVLESTMDIEKLQHSEEGHDHEDEEEHQHEENHSHQYDPHTWLDPMTYAQQAENVKDSLVALDEANQAEYEANYQALYERLSALDQSYQEGLSQRENRTIVVQHTAFGYLAAAYDLEQVSISGLSTDQEPSAQELAEMQDFVVENDVKVIYVDPFSDNTIAQTVANANGAELRHLRTLESLSQEELTSGVTYFDIMEQNLMELMQ